MPENNVWSDCWQELLCKYFIKFVEDLSKSLSDNYLFPPNKVNTVVINNLMSSACESNETEKGFTMCITGISVSRMFFARVERASQSLSLQNIRCYLTIPETTSRLCTKPGRCILQGPVLFRSVWRSYIGTTWVSCCRFKCFHSRGLWAKNWSFPARGVGSLHIENKKDWCSTVNREYLDRHLALLSVQT